MVKNNNRKPSKLPGVKVSPSKMKSKMYKVRQKTFLKSVKPNAPETAKKNSSGKIKTEKFGTEMQLLYENPNSSYDSHLISSFNYNPDAELLRRCGQSVIEPFDEIYSAKTLKKCRKIGEGVFGEVFFDETASKLPFVLKIVPIEGGDEINGAQQKRFAEILQEVIISQALSALRTDKENSTSGFVEVFNVRLVQGCYPSHLLNLWYEYKCLYQSNNDDPANFGDEQLYVVFELAESGTNLETYKFENAEQSLSVYKQVTASLAVAESKFQFEHRDLHSGNILIAPTTRKAITFVVNGHSVKVPTHGVKATIIDYSLSRMVYDDCCLYQNLGAGSDIFSSGNGDYQLEIYRMMRLQTGNRWESFEPFTNVLWIHYMLIKMVKHVRYSQQTDKQHQQAIRHLVRLCHQVIEQPSAEAVFDKLF